MFTTVNLPTIAFIQSIVYVCLLACFPDARASLNLPIPGPDLEEIVPCHQSYTFKSGVELKSGFQGGVDPAESGERFLELRQRTKLQQVKLLSPESPEWVQREDLHILPCSVMGLQWGCGLGHNVHRLPYSQCLWVSRSEGSITRMLLKWSMNLW